MIKLSINPACALELGKELFRSGEYNRAIYALVKSGDPEAVPLLGSIGTLTRLGSLIQMNALGGLQALATKAPECTKVAINELLNISLYKELPYLNSIASMILGKTLSRIEDYDIHQEVSLKIEKACLQQQEEWTGIAKPRSIERLQIYCNIASGLHDVESGERLASLLDNSTCGIEQSHLLNAASNRLSSPLREALGRYIGRNLEYQNIQLLDGQERAVEILRQYSSN